MQFFYKTSVSWSERLNPGTKYEVLRPWRRASILLERFWILWENDEGMHELVCKWRSRVRIQTSGLLLLDIWLERVSRFPQSCVVMQLHTYMENTAKARFWSLFFSTSRSHAYIIIWLQCLCTHWWHSLTRSRSVVAGGRPRMYRLVLLSCSGPVLLLLLLLLGLDGVMG